MWDSDAKCTALQQASAISSLVMRSKVHELNIWLIIFCKKEAESYMTVLPQNFARVQSGLDEKAGGIVVVEDI